MDTEQTKSKAAIEPGIPLQEFDATVETLEELQRSGKFQVFLANDNVIRLIGEIDEFRVAFGKRLGADTVERRKAQDCLEEFQRFLQVVLVTGKLPVATAVFENEIYEEEFEKLKDNPTLASELRTFITKKLRLISDKFASDTLRNRRRRLATIVGPILEDMDIEIISKRKSSAHLSEIEGPFLKVCILYSFGGETRFPFNIPPWITNPPRNVKSFGLECDEADIDLLVSRLLQAKELLRKEIDAKIPNKGIGENT